MIADLAAGARFVWGLPGALRRPLDPTRARATLQARLERREADFLALVQRLIYGYPASPYRPLLALAGCEPGDLERLVRTDGVEGALRSLYRRGVYLTVEEFKGQRPAVRGSATVAVDPGRLRNRAAASHLTISSGGKRGTRTPAPLDFAFIRDGAVDKCLVFEALGGLGWRHALWSVPGAAALFRLVEFAALGARPVRWFSQLHPAAPSLHPRYRWSAHATRWVSLLAGSPLPGPEHVPLDQPLPIVRWLAAELRAGRTPHLHTFPGSAVRLSQAARAAGVSLQGAHVAVGGEPITPSRLATIRDSGAEVSTRYGSTETGEIGYGCLASSAPDEVHLLHDLLALVQPNEAGPAAGLPSGALLYSTLRPTAPFVLLNVSSGDQAEVLERACGCPLERLGWTTHLHTIRSFEKLTGEGMTFFDAEVGRVLEEVLPGRFGGGPTDYQLLEDEATDGRPRLRLLVDPRLGLLDERAVAAAFLAALGAGSGVERVMALQWQQAGLLRVERRSPLVTAAGKVLPIQRRPAAARPG